LQVTDREADVATRRLNLAGNLATPNDWAHSEKSLIRLSAIVAAAKKDAFEHPELGDMVRKRALQDVAAARESYNGLTLEEIQQRKARGIPARPSGGDPRRRGNSHGRDWGGLARFDQSACQPERAHGPRL
jgi:hypothetical protein